VSNSDLLDNLDGDLIGDGDGRTLLDVIEAESPEWDILAVDIADRNGSTVWCLVIRRRVSDEGNMILSERYFQADLGDLTGGYIDNGIERRITGSLGAALRVLYAATTDGTLDPDSPMLIDSTHEDREGLTYQPEELTEPITPASEVEEESETSDVIEQEPETREIEMVDRKGSTSEEPDLSEGEVECKRCGETVDKSEAVQFGRGDLGEFWIHDGDCPEGGEADE
jgi:hypothetical protein